jgi:enhancing lycopene biosynthesis protein 2
MSDVPLFAEPRRRRGAAEALLAKTLRAWHEADHLAGDKHSAARGVLRDAARAVDAARADMRTGEGTAYSFARTNELYRQALDALGPGGEVTTDDTLDALIAELGAGPVRDTA